RPKARNAPSSRAPRHCSSKRPSPASQFTPPLEENREIAIHCRRIIRDATEHSVVRFLLIFGFVTQYGLVPGNGSDVLRSRRIAGVFGRKWLYYTAKIGEACVRSHRGPACRS